MLAEKTEQRDATPLAEHTLGSPARSQGVTRAADFLTIYGSSEASFSTQTSGVVQAEYMRRAELAPLVSKLLGEEVFIPTSSLTAIAEKFAHEAAALAAAPTPPSLHKRALDIASMIAELKIAPPAQDDSPSLTAATLHQEQRSSIQAFATLFFGSVKYILEQSREPGAVMDPIYQNPRVYEQREAFLETLVPLIPSDLTVPSTVIPLVKEALCEGIEALQPLSLNKEAREEAARELVRKLKNISH